MKLRVAEKRAHLKTREGGQGGIPIDLCIVLQLSCNGQFQCIAHSCPGSLSAGSADKHAQDPIPDRDGVFGFCLCFFVFGIWHYIWYLTLYILFTNPAYNFTLALKCFTQPLGLGLAEYELLEVYWPFVFRALWAPKPCDPRRWILI